MTDEVPIEHRYWKGDMEADYIYTAGIAGEKFFREILDNERLIGTFCPRCRVTYLPPRMYCESCFAELKEWEEVPNKGIIDTFTIAYVDEKERKLPKPAVWALVRFPGTRGGLIQRVDLPPEEVEVGMEVEVVFKERKERVGSILDMDHLKAI